MSLYLLIPNSEQTPFPDLSHLAEASQTLVTGEAREIIQSFLELAGGALSRFPSWSLVEVSLPKAELPPSLGKLIGDQIAREGASVLDLEEKQVKLAGVLAVAAENGYSVGLVAVVEPSTPKSLDSILLHTLKAFGGRVSLPLIHRRLKAHSLAELRAGLDRLAEQGLVAKSGSSIRWMQFAAVGLEAQHWLEAQILRVLKSGPLSSSEMCNTFQVPISSLLEPLATLHAGGLVEATGNGPNRRYRLAQGASCFNR